MSEKQTKFVWRYKDSYRFWWEIRMEKTETVHLVEDGDPHYEWDYELWRDEVRIHSSFVKGQYDYPPTLDEIMLDFTTYITSVAMGVAKYGKLKE